MIVTEALVVREDHPDHHMNTSYVPAAWEVIFQVYVAPSRAHKLFAPYGEVPPDTCQVPVEEVPLFPLSTIISAACA
jgi:hypothetical protein